jgi:hypothetical protein
VNGQVFQGNPRDIPLASRENVRLEVGTPPVAPQYIDWPKTRPLTLTRAPGDW